MKSQLSQEVLEQIPEELKLFYEYKQVVKNGCNSKRRK